MIYQEGNLQFDFSQALTSRRFDQSATHGLSHCMKAVDFIVELPNRTLFIEVKDPENPQIPAQYQTQNRLQFTNRFLSNELALQDLVPKFRDSYLYEHAMGRLAKPVYYFVLIALNTLTAPELDNQTLYLHRQLPVDGPPHQNWNTKFVHRCLVFNLTSWNKHLPQFPITRLPSA